MIRRSMMHNTAGDENYLVFARYLCVSLILDYKGRLCRVDMAPYKHHKLHAAPFHKCYAKM